LAQVHSRPQAQQLSPPIIAMARVAARALLAMRLPWSEPKVAKCDEKADVMPGQDFAFSLGPPESGFSIFMADRTKKVYFIRHAEGYHNVATKEAGSNSVLLRGDVPANQHPLWDARLTPAGIKQAESLGERLSRRHSHGHAFTAFDLVVVSPLTRTLETAHSIFGPVRAPGTPAFLDANVVMRGGYKVPLPRVLVREECRERWGRYVCDGRRPIHEIMLEFPDFDFGELIYDEDVFYTDEREPDEDCCRRAVSFLEWLNKRPEHSIAVVTHSSFLRHLFSQFGGNVSVSDQRSMHSLAGNCELREVVICSHGVKESLPLQHMEPKS